MLEDGGVGLRGSGSRVCLEDEDNMLMGCMLIMMCIHKLLHIPYDLKLQFVGIANSIFTVINILIIVIFQLLKCYEEFSILPCYQTLILYSDEWSVPW